VHNKQEVVHILLKKTTDDISVLLARLQRNEPHAFEGLYNKCSGYVSFVCAKFCDNKEDVEEIVQDTFVIAFKKANELRSETLLSYLRKIAVHECFRRRKANSRRLILTAAADDLPYDLLELDKALLPEDALLDKERQAQVLVAISKLPKTQREVIYLYYYIDFSTKQIAELMECTPNCVCITLTRARKTLKRNLEQDRLPAIAAKALVLLPLAALFLAEESTYLAAYQPIILACTATTATAAAATTTTTSAIAGYIAAACATLILGTAVSVYIHLQTEPETVLATPPAATTPAPTSATPPPPLLTPAPTTPPPTTPAPTTTPETTPAPTTAPPTPVPTQPPPPPTSPAPPSPIEDLPPPDRTQNVLAALAQAHTQAQLDQILANYGFAFDTDIHTPTDVHLSFHRFNEGSGDIWVGMATSTSDNAWRMQYTFYAGEIVSKDSVDLYIWMQN